MQGQISAESAKNVKIGVVTARFNSPVTEPLEAGALEELVKRGVSEENIHQVRVPGAVEIPLAAQALLDKGVDGVVTLGAVIRGDTAHFDYVCNSVERACTQLQIEYKKPVGFGVLTTENAEQAYARAGGEKGNKGNETAEVVLEMIELLKEIRNL
ncbi:MAG: 6,7-dimethyl-8-ribityllumazine synthase [Bdellovibrionales bacterium]|nr:6,7-dimethyl-8-ribityllumazine synthase [Bdellovibrionales bacterium]